MAKLNTVNEVKLTYTTKGNHTKTICDSYDSAQVFKDHFDEDQIGYKEFFYIICLDIRNRVLGVTKISEGGVSGTVVDKRMIFQTALLCNASSIILGHNHPSGTLIPSGADNKITKDICDGAKLLDIRVLDHIIITEHGGHYSYANEGTIEPNTGQYLGF